MDEKSVTPNAEKRESQRIQPLPEAHTRGTENMEKEYEQNDSSNNSETSDETLAKPDPESALERVKTEVDVPPNGGYGWVVAIAVSVLNAHAWGLNSTYGVFLAHYLANNTFPGATSLQYAFVGSLSISCAMLVSPLATIGARELGVRPTMFIGVILESMAFICASFATKIWHLFLTQGMMFGFGIGFVFTPSVPIPPQWFTTKRSLANAISVTGSGLGGVIYSFACGAMIPNMGLQWTFRILGIIAFVVNTICTLLMRDRNKAIGSRGVAFDTVLFKRVEYLLVIAWGWLSIMAYVVLCFSLANYANDIGLSSSQAAIVSALFNLGQSIARPFIGFFSDRTGRINMCGFATFLASVFTFVIWINAKSYGVLIFCAIMNGTVGGIFWTVVGPVTAEVVGLRDVPSALNIMWIMIMLPSTFSEPCALEIVEHTGSYLGTQLWTGAMFLAAAACMLVLRGWKIAETAEIARAVEEAPQHMDPWKVANSEAVKERGRRYGRQRMFADCFKLSKV